MVYLLLISAAKPVLPPLHLYHTKILTVSLIGFFLITTNNITISMIITITSSSICWCVTFIPNTWCYCCYLPPPPICFFLINHHSSLSLSSSSQLYPCLSLLNCCYCLFSLTLFCWSSLSSTILFVCVEGWNIYQIARTIILDFTTY